MKRAVALIIGLGLTPAFAADHEVRMLNYGEDGSMVFEPAYLRAEVGDTVTFVPANSGHNVRSYAVPKGAEPWKSAVDERYTVTLDKEGVYLYYCPPHLMMSMIGVVQAGKPINLADLKDSADKLRSKLVMKGERLDAYLAKAE
ncbi:MAG TPA: pseudoazurin [Sinorhizobium sp.]|nr:pseudoazurin [Sinorhizobium sp.]